MSLDRRSRVTTTMDDGTVLVADLWLPEGRGPWPVLLQRLPYGRAVASSIVLPHPIHLARLGYAVMVQDCRGCGDSGGAFVPYVDEAEDGARTIEWLADQAWCDGRVVTYGFSYQGLAQLYAAGRRPEPLVAIAPFQCAPGPGEGWTFDGGCLRWDFVAPWAAQLIGLDGTHRPHLDLGAQPTLGAIGPPRPDWLTGWLETPAGPGWEAMAPDPPAPGLPALVVGGWHDTFAAGSWRLAEALDAEVVFGPWAHIPWGTRHATGDHGPEASPARAHDRFERFLAHVLRDGPAPPSRTEYHTIGAGWRRAPSWPLDVAGVQRWRAVGGRANSRHGNGRLGPDPGGPDPGGPDTGGSAAPDVLVAEPRQPVPGTLDPMTDERGVEDRRDVLCFTSEPLRAEAVLTGIPRVTVTTRADVASHDLIASLTAVAPDGMSVRITSGANRLAPGDVGAWRGSGIALAPTSWRLPRGSRLRIDLSASRFPAYDRNPQNGRSAAHASPSACRIATIEVRDLVVDLPFE